MEIFNSKSGYEWLKSRIRRDVEEVWALGLDSRLRLLGGELLFRGSVRECPLHPRELFRFGLRVDAVSLIIAHSHPSGDTQPSEEDLEVTRRLVLLGKCLELPVVDHLIIGDGGYASLADQGHFMKWNRRRNHWSKSFIAG